MITYSNMAAIERRLRELRRLQPVERVFKDRHNPLEYLSRGEVYQRYRFYPETVMFIVGRLYDRLEAPTRRSLPVPPLLSVLVTLQFFASDAHYVIVGDVHGISTSTVCRAVMKTTRLLTGLLGEYVSFPRTADEVRVKQREFYSIARFPKIVGVIDGTHIPIKGPSENEADFVNRKGKHSINVQMVCDARFRVINLVADWPGSVHDSRMFRDSTLCAMFERGELSGLLIGDSGYACRPFLLTPYHHPQTPVQGRFNNALTRTRVLIEQTFGVLKRRFPCLSYGLRCSPERACETVTACVVLHNMGIMRGDVLGRETEIRANVMEADDVGVDDVQGARFRDAFANAYF